MKRLGIFLALAIALPAAAASYYSYPSGGAIDGTEIIGPVRQRGADVTLPLSELKGNAGAAGATGRGIQSTAQNAQNHLIITYTDGTTQDVGALPAGPQGIPGTASNQGAPGRGITSTAVNGSNHLIITYTDGTTQDAGLLPAGATGATGPTGATGATGPAGPSISAENTNQYGGYRTAAVDGFSVIWGTTGSLAANSATAITLPVGVCKSAVVSYQVTYVGGAVSRAAVGNPAITSFNLISDLAGVYNWRVECF